MPNEVDQRWKIDKAYIDGAFVPVQGSEVGKSVNPVTEDSSVKNISSD